MSDLTKLAVGVVAVIACFYAALALALLLGIR